MELTDAFSVRGEVDAYVFDGDVDESQLMTILGDRSRPEWSRLAGEYHNHNLVTNIGRQQMVAIIVGASTALVTYMGLSTTNSSSALTDTALTNELYRGAIAIAQSFGTYSQRYVAFFPTAAVFSTGIAAEGLFDTITTGGKLWAEAGLVISKTSVQGLVIDHRILASS